MLTGEKQEPIFVTNTLYACLILKKNSSFCAEIGISKFQQINTTTKKTLYLGLPVRSLWFRSLNGPGISNVLHHLRTKNALLKPISLSIRGPRNTTSSQKKIST